MINSSYWMTRVKHLSEYGGDSISELSVMKSCRTIPLVNEVYFNDEPLKLYPEKGYYSNINQITEAFQRIRQEVDIIHCRGNEPFDLIRKETSKPMIYFGSPEIDKYNLQDRTGTYLKKAINKDRFGKAQAIEVFAPCWRDWLIEDFDQPPEKVHVIPQAVDLNVFKPMDVQELRDRYDVDCILGYVGSTQETYLRVDMHRLMKRILRHNKKTLLMILTYDLQKNKYLMFDDDTWGHVVAYSVKHEEMPKYYNLFDITLCLGTAPYAGNMKELECQACGSPTVAFDLPNRRHRFGEDYPYLAGIQPFHGLRMEEESYDEHDLADKIIYLMDNEKERKKIGKRNVKQAKKFSYKEVGKLIMNMYGGIL